MSSTLPVCGRERQSVSTRGMNSFDGIARDDDHDDEMISCRSTSGERSGGGHGLEFSIGIGESGSGLCAGARQRINLAGTGTGINISKARLLHITIPVKRYPTTCAGVG